MIHDQAVNRLVINVMFAPLPSVKVDIKLYFVVLVAGIKGGFITHPVFRANSAVRLATGSRVNITLEDQLVFPPIIPFEVRL